MTRRNFSIVTNVQSIRVGFCDGSTPPVESVPGYNRTMTTAVEIGSLIDRDPRIRGGRPKIAGTGVTVMRIAGWYKMGRTPEEIADGYGHLNLAQVHAALAYYHANSDEIEADLAEEEAFFEEVERGSQHRLLQ